MQKDSNNSDWTTVRGYLVMMMMMMMTNKQDKVCLCSSRNRQRKSGGEQTLRVYLPQVYKLRSNILWRLFNGRVALAGAKGW